MLSVLPLVTGTAGLRSRRVWPPPPWRVGRRRDREWLARAGAAHSVVKPTSSLRSIPMCFRLGLALIIFSGVVALPAAETGGQTGVTAQAWAHLPPHPRLFATSAQWQELRARLATDPVAAAIFANIRAQADALLSQPAVAIRQRPRGVMSGTMLEPAREIQRRVLLLAATARLTDDLRYATRAQVELEVLVALPDWNPAVFLDTAEATLAAAVGLDWLFDTLAPADRDALAAAIAAKGLRASFDSPAKMLTWVSGTNNWNQVCHGALVIGALAVAEREPALAQRVVQRAVEHLHSSARVYAPDGGYPEGPMYWAYGTTFHVAMLAALESALGDRAGLDRFPGFLATADYLTEVTGPTGTVFNYADSVERPSFEPALFWFARRLQQPLAPRLKAEATVRVSARSGSKPSRFLPLALLWWDPALAKLPPRDLPLHWQGRGAVPIGVHRSGWDDPRAVFVAIKGGRPGVSHGHMDAGSFVLEADGLRWAVDPGVQSYGTLYQAGIDTGLWRFTQDSPRWTVFRIGAEGHNIMRFGGAAQRVEGVATLDRFEGSGALPYSQIDLTPVYRGQVEAARRGVALLPDRRVIIQDEWTTIDRPTDIAWQWLTRADVTLEPHGALLSQKGERLRLRVVEPSTATLTVDETARLLQSHDEPNPGLRRLVIKMSSPAAAKGRLVVIAEPGSAKVESPAPIVRPLADW
jgi:oligo-alginate lyase